MVLDLHNQSATEILSVLKAKGLKIRFNPRATAAPSKLVIKESKYSALLAEMIELREALAA